MALSPQRRYQDELKRYGLGLGGRQSPSKLTFDAPVKGGSVQRKLRGGIGSSGAMRTPFAEDGPSAAGYDFEQEQFPDDPLAGLTREEAIDYLVSMGIDMENPTFGMSGIAKRAKNRPESILPGISSDVGSITEFAEAYAKLAETNRPEPSISERPDMVSLMKSNPSAFADSPLDAIAAQIAKAQIDPSLSGANDSEIAQRMIEDRKRSAEEAAAVGVDAVLDDKMNKDAIAGLGISNDSSEKNPEEAVQTAFVEAMNPYLEALNKKVPTANNREELLEKYKKEFSEATGIEINGKVDKSQALMAMGLSLMQNRAGKGFNVGKLLNAVGQAGDAAMPYLREATKEAKAAQLAAGRYALDKIAQGESATAAFNEEVRASADNWMLEKFKAANAIELEKIKSDGKANEMKNVASVPIGAGDLKVRIGDKNGVSVFASGPTDAGAIVNAYTKYTEGQENIDIMKDALSAIASKDSSALSTLADRAKSIGVAWGIVDGEDMFGPKGISDEAEFNKYRQATINAFKRLILQESQVSNLDLTTLFASFGDVEFMQNPKEAELAIDLMNQYFAAKKRSLEPVLTDFYDRSWFRSDEDYNRTQEKLSKINEVFDPKVTSEVGERMTLDLSTIPTLKTE